MAPQNQQNQNTFNRDTASRDPQRRRETASEDRFAADDLTDDLTDDLSDEQQDTALEFGSEEAAEADRKGGQALNQDREPRAYSGAEGRRRNQSGQNSSPSGADR